MRRRKLYAPLVLLGLGVVGVIMMFLTREPPPQVQRRRSAPMIEVVVAQPSDIRLTVRTQGTVVPRTESDLVAQVAGEITWVSPSLVSGGFFEKGDVLVQIDRADYEADVALFRATVARRRSEFAHASTELKRRRLLGEKEIASLAEIEDAENSYTVSQALVNEARAQLVRAERDLERTVLKAPFEGRVRSEHMDVGQFVNRGSVLATLYAVDFAEVRLPLPDRELRFLDLPLGLTPGAQEGQELAGPEVRLHAEFAGEQRSWLGRIVRTEGEIDARSRMVNIVARVKDPYGRHTVGTDGAQAPLAVGLFVEAVIEGKQVEGVYSLPRSALRTDERGGGSRVYVVDSGSRLRIQSVQLLRAEGERVIIGSGIAPGDRVMISPLLGVVDGMTVRVVGEPAEPAEPGRNGVASEPPPRAEAPSPSGS